MKPFLPSSIPYLTIPREKTASTLRNVNKTYSLYFSTELKIFTNNRKKVGFVSTIDNFHPTRQYINYRNARNQTWITIIWQRRYQIQLQTVKYSCIIEEIKKNRKWSIFLPAMWTVYLQIEPLLSKNRLLS